MICFRVTVSTLIPSPTVVGQPSSRSAQTTKFMMEEDLLVEMGAQWRALSGFTKLCGPIYTQR